MIEVLYEDNHIIAVNKKPGDLVQGDKTGDKPLGEFVKDYLLQTYLYSQLVTHMAIPITSRFQLNPQPNL